MMRFRLRAALVLATNLALAADSQTAGVLQRTAETMTIDFLATGPDGQPVGATRQAQRGSGSDHHLCVLAPQCACHTRALANSRRREHLARDRASLRHVAGAY